MFVLVEKGPVSSPPTMAPRIHRNQDQEDEILKVSYYDMSRAISELEIKTDEIETWN